MHVCGWMYGWGWMGERLQEGKEGGDKGGRDVWMDGLAVQCVHGLSAPRVSVGLAARACLGVNSGESVEPLPLGKIASHFYLDYHTVAMFHHRLTRDLDIPQLLTLLCDAAEFAELPVRHNEDKVNEELARSIRWPVDAYTFDSPHTKTNLLLQCHMARVPLPMADYMTDTKSVLDQMLRVANALIDVSVQYGWLTTASRVMNIVQMMVQGRFLDDSTLLNLPHITRRVAEALAAAPHRIECLPELMALPAARLTTVLGAVGVSAGNIAKIDAVLRRLPQIEVDWTVPECTACVAAANVTVTVQLTRVHGTSHRGARAYTPVFPKAKEEGYWLLLGRRDTRDLVALKRISLLRQALTNELTFSLPATAGVYPYELSLVSDCYLGLDQEYTFDITVA
jgi:activating signal cointegrator complex subunit 3